MGATAPVGLPLASAHRPVRRDRVEIRFIPAAEAATRIEIEHAGWERLGDAGPQWRDRNRMGWTTLLPHFQAAARPG